MKIKKHLFRLIVGFAAFAIGLTWFSVWQYFQMSFENIEQAKQLAETTQSDWGNIRQKYNSFSAELDENSSEPNDEVRPIVTKNLETPTKEAEKFNPVGRYYFLEEHKGFEDIFFISIQNKDLDLNPDDEDVGNLVSLVGFFVVEDKDSGAEDGCGMHDYIEVPIIKIEDGKISFISKKKKGVTYEFNGKFLFRENSRTVDVDGKVLKGILMKKKNGKIIAKKELTFGRDITEQCFH